MIEIESIDVVKTSYNATTKTSTYKLTFTLGSGDTVDSSTFTITDGNVTTLLAQQVLTDYLNTLTTGRVVVTTTVGPNVVLSTEAKGTAFNKDFGTGANNVARGNHSHTAYALATVEIIAGTGLLITDGFLNADVTIDIDPDYDGFTEYYTSDEIDALLADYTTTLDLTALLAGYSPTVHTHTVSQITNITDYYYTEIESDALFSPIVHTHTESDITDLSITIETINSVDYVTPSTVGVGLQTLAGLKLNILDSATAGTPDSTEEGLLRLRNDTVARVYYLEIALINSLGPTAYAWKTIYSYDYSGA
jgi:hypothetical protein